MTKFSIRTFCLLLSLAVHGITQAQTLTWSSEVNVAMGNMYGSVRPRITLTANDVPVVIWGGGMSTEPLYAARWNGTGFGTPVQITPPNVDPFVMGWGGPDLGASGNTVYAVFKRQPEMMNYIFIVKSTDGGITWSDTTRVETMTGAYARFPSVAVTPSGNPAVMFMTFNSSWGDAEYVVANSLDGGQTFQSPVNVSAGGGSDVCDCCPGYMTIAGNTQVASFRRNNNNMRDMWAAISTNAGITFPSAVDIDNTNWMINSCPSSGPSPYLWNDSLITVFMSGSSGDDRIIITASNIATQQMGVSTMLAGNVPSSSAQNYPFIAGNADTMAVVWQQNDNGNVNTYYTWSVTGTAGLINNQAILSSVTANSQSAPHVAYSNGTFHFVFTDGSSGNVKYKTATIIPSTGMDEASNGPNTIIILNPSQGDATVSFRNPGKEPVQVSIYDMSGRLCGEYSTDSDKLIIENGALAQGVHLVRVTGQTILPSCVKLVIQ
jgi:hypothetical protein